MQQGSVFRTGRPSLNRCGWSAFEISSFVHSRSIPQGADESVVSPRCGIVYVARHACQGRNGGAVSGAGVNVVSASRLCCVLLFSSVFSKFFFSGVKMSRPENAQEVPTIHTSNPPEESQVTRNPLARKGQARSRPTDVFCLFGPGSENSTLSQVFFSPGEIVHGSPNLALISRTRAGTKSGQRDTSMAKGCMSMAQMDMSCRVHVCFCFASLACHGWPVREEPSPGRTLHEHLECLNGWRYDLQAHICSRTHAAPTWGCNRASAHRRDGTGPASDQTSSRQSLLPRFVQPQEAPLQPVQGTFRGRQPGDSPENSSAGYGTRDTKG